MMFPKFGPLELILILVIVTMLFGVGKLPEVFGAVGRGIREFRKNAAVDTDEPVVETREVETPAAPATPAATTVPSSPNGVPVNEPTHQPK